MKTRSLKRLRSLPALCWTILALDRLVPAAWAVLAVAMVLSASAQIQHTWTRSFGAATLAGMSLDGLSFSFMNLSGGNLRAATWAHGLWIVVGNDGIITTSPDLITWTRRASRTFENQHQVALLDSRLVVIGNRGTVLQSGRFVTELEAPVLVTGTGVRLPFKGVLNQAYEVQSSTNLVNWTTLSTIWSAAEDNEFTDTNAWQHLRQFYRLVEP